MLGMSAAFAGDVNGDGFSDLILGEPGNDSLAGRAYIHHGSAGGPSAFPDALLTRDVLGDRFGNAIAGAGDVDDDGYDDVIIGDPNYSNGQTKEGACLPLLWL